jgi:hypothetical protein
MECERAGSTLHQLVLQAAARSAQLQEECAAAAEQTRYATEVLHRTVADVRRARSVRQAFGNRQFDASEGSPPG